MSSSQKYFPIATIDNENELRLVEYNHGVKNLKTSNVKGPLEASFSVRNAKRSVDFPKFEFAIEQNINQLFRLRGSCEITLVEYMEEEILINFKYTGCTPWQFTQALFKTSELDNISNNGSKDWIPLDTQSAINMYPGYDKQTAKKPSLMNDSQLEGSSQIILAKKTSAQLNDQPNYDWRLAYLEEAFNSFSQNSQAHFNIRKEGVIVISVVREWLVSHRIQEFMHSIFALSQILRAKSSETKTLFWCLTQFKNIFEGFHQARAIYDGLAKYKDHFKEIYSDHEAQMTGHLEALELHLAIIIDPSLEPSSQSMDARIMELSELLRLCSKTMLEFTVALQRKLASIAESSETAHKRMVGNAVIAAVSVGVAVYSRPTRLAARAAHFAAVVGSCGLAYYFYKLEKELRTLKLEQENAIELSVAMTKCFREHFQSCSDKALGPSIKLQAELLADLSRVQFVSLKDDLHVMREKLEQLTKPKPERSVSRYISWW